ncbi:uncharacterized protein LOC124336821 isoform X2 [Daphnia pulicaria]|uniref:uncharacterized protein LOC124336821 isoform X2 n=1 Tax=Daphnia pulicaria TaxID=35523 RepID=UPI001EECDA57|nr:uncharacterized protein LOC124336821 isoform X2 [Daphnia pulicaria]
MITFILQMIIRGAALVSSSSASLIFMSQQFLVSSETLRARLLLSYITIYSFTSRFRDLSAMPQRFLWNRLQISENPYRLVFYDELLHQFTFSNLRSVDVMVDPVHRRNRGYMLWTNQNAWIVARLR